MHFQTYSSNKKALIALSDRLDSLETMKFPDALDARAVGRNKLLPCVIFSSYQIHASSVYDRKLIEISEDLRRISEQNMVETIANMAQDESTIVGWVVDLNELLMDYQVILGKLTSCYS
jgi:hypothetical protein